MERTPVGLLVVLLGAAFAPAAPAVDLGKPDVARWIAEAGGQVTSDPATGGVRVDLGFTGVEDDGIELLVQIPNLTSLDLSRARVTDIGFERIKDLKKVIDLNLFFEERITDVALTQIQGWKLERLSVRGADITDAGLEHISRLGTLKSLDVSFTLITNNGLDYLASLTHLQDLALGGNKITGAGLHVLKSLPDLSRLNLNGTQRRNTEFWTPAVTDFDLDTLASLKQLQDLNLGGAKITDLGLSKLKSVAGLRALDVSRTQVTSQGLKDLAGLPKLERLSLWKDGQIDDAAAAHLIAMKNLVTLDLADTKLTDKGLEMLQKLSGLRHLYLDGTSVTAAGVRRFQQANPHCQVAWK